NLYRIFTGDRHGCVTNSTNIRAVASPPQVRARPRASPQRSDAAFEMHESFRRAPCGERTSVSARQWICHRRGRALAEFLGTLQPIACGPSVLPEEVLQIDAYPRARGTTENRGVLGSIPSLALLVPWVPSRVTAQPNAAGH